MILILHENAAEIAKMLDDTQLSKQIKAISQILCNEHHRITLEELEYRCKHSLSRISVINQGKNIPLHLEMDRFKHEWGGWIKKCRANYNKLVEIGMACCFEYLYRKTLNINFEEGQKNKHKLQSVIEWAKNNTPSLPNDNENHPLFKLFFPVVMPKIIYKLRDSLPFPHVIKPYKNYYRVLLQKIIERKGKKYLCDSLIYPKWTRREAPDFLADLVR